MLSAESKSEERSNAQGSGPSVSPLPRFGGEGSTAWFGAQQERKAPPGAFVITATLRHGQGEAAAAGHVRAVVVCNLQIGRQIVLRQARAVQDICIGRGVGGAGGPGSVDLQRYSGMPHVETGLAVLGNNGNWTPVWRDEPDGAVARTGCTVILPDDIDPLWHNPMAAGGAVLGFEAGFLMAGTVLPLALVCFRACPEDADLDALVTNGPLGSLVFLNDGGGVFTQSPQSTKLCTWRLPYSPLLR
mgnify:CR=1 FL=1